MCRKRWHTVCIVQIVSVLYAMATFLISVDLRGLCMITAPEYITQRDRNNSKYKEPADDFDAWYRTKWKCLKGFTKIWDTDATSFLEAKLPHDNALCFLVTEAPVHISNVMKYIPFKEDCCSEYGDVGYKSGEGLPSGDWYLNEVSFRNKTGSSLHWDNLMRVPWWNVSSALADKGLDVLDEKKCETTFCMAQKEPGRNNGRWLYTASVLLVSGSYLVAAGYRAYHWKREGRVMAAFSFFVCVFLSSSSAMACVIVDASLGMIVLRLLGYPTLAASQVLHSLFSENVRESIAFGELIALLTWTLNFGLLTALLMWACWDEMTYHWLALGCGMMYSVPFAFVLEGSLQDSEAELLSQASEGIEVAHLNPSFS